MIQEIIFEAQYVFQEHKLLKSNLSRLGQENNLYQAMLQILKENAFRTYLVSFYQIALFNMPLESIMSLVLYVPVWTIY